MKVCGITRLKDAQFAEACGAWAVGVVMCSNSPRAVSLATARKIFTGLSPSTVTVAVTHTMAEGDIREILTLHPTALQIYHPHYIQKELQVKVFRVVKQGEPLPEDCDALVVDESHGAGKQYNLSFAEDVVRQSHVPVILAGGLTPGNVREAIHRIHPYAVDVSSGVEESPGIKDSEKVSAFLTICREIGS